MTLIKVPETRDVTAATPTTGTPAPHHHLKMRSVSGVATASTGCSGPSAKKFTLLLHGEMTGRNDEKMPSSSYVYSWCSLPLYVRYWQHRVRAFINDTFLSLANSIHASVSHGFNSIHFSIVSPSRCLNCVVIFVQDASLRPHQLAPLCDRNSCVTSSTSANSTSTSLTSVTSCTTFSTMATRLDSWLSRHRYKGLPLCLSASATTSILLPLLLWEMLEYIR
jgi:hypothetical protein